MSQHILRFSDIASTDGAELLNRSIVSALAFKRAGKRAEVAAEQAVLKGAQVVMLFEKPSLRTKLSFAVAIEKLGGNAVYFSADEVGLGQRESIADVARVVSSMGDLVIIRTHEHSRLEQFAEYSAVPVINALSDAEHPCQALADIVTLREHFGKLPVGYKVAYVGDGNNVAISLAWAALMTKGQITLCAPAGYEPPVSALPDSDAVTVTNDLREAVKGAKVVYTDTWVSMGDEATMDERLRKFAPYQVTRDVMQCADSGAVLMHCLPAHDGQEIARGLLSEPFSICFQQAENRLWAQMGLIYQMYNGD